MFRGVEIMNYNDNTPEISYCKKCKGFLLQGWIEQHKHGNDFIVRKYRNRWNEKYGDNNNKK